MKVLAVIPARKDSKGIKNKNHLKLNGKSLVEIAIQEAQKSKIINRLIFSSNDKNLISKIKKRNFKKVEIPFVRPENISNDKASSYSVLKHAYYWLKKNNNWKADIVVLLQPTTPFRTKKIIDDSIKLLIKNKKSDAVITITDVEYPPYWMFKKDKKKLIPLIHGSNKFTRRQDTPKALKPAGLVYALRTNFLMNKLKGILPNKKTLGYYVNPNFCINIDNYDQYLLSKIKIKKKYK